MHLTNLIQLDVGKIFGKKGLFRVHYIVLVLGPHFENPNIDCASKLSLPKKKKKARLFMLDLLNEHTSILSLTPTLLNFVVDGFGSLTK